MKKTCKNSDITATVLQDDILGPIITKVYREQLIKRMKDYKYLAILGFYIMSVLQNFESFPKTEIDLVKDDIRLVSDE